MLVSAMWFIFLWAQALSLYGFFTFLLKFWLDLYSDYVRACWFLVGPLFWLWGLFCFDLCCCAQTWWYAVILFLSSYLFLLESSVLISISMSLSKRCGGGFVVFVKALGPCCPCLIMTIGQGSLLKEIPELLVSFSVFIDCLDWLVVAFDAFVWLVDRLLSFPLLWFGITAFFSFSTALFD